MPNNPPETNRNSPLNRAGNSLAGEHLPALDGVRGLAILLVTAYRFNGVPVTSLSTEHWTSHVTAIGLRGVDLFFVLSGFLITRILLQAKEQPHYFRNFYARRAIRIFPLYYAVLLVVFVLLPLTSTRASAIFDGPRAHESWLWLYGTNIYQSLHADWAFGCFNHFWSLAVEEHFYFVWPLVVFLLKPRAAMAACVLLIGVACVSRVGWLATTGNDVAAEVFTLFRADSLAMGALAALLVARWGSARLAPFASAGAWVFGAALVVCTIGNRRMLTIPDTLYAAFFACLIVLTIESSRTTRFGSFWNASLLRFFGKYSYGMYVFQNPLIPLLAPILSIELLLHYLPNETTARLVYFVLMTSITTVAALASWHLFEKRFMALKKYFPSGPPNVKECGGDMVAALSPEPLQETARHR